MVQSWRERMLEQLRALQLDQQKLVRMTGELPASLNPYIDDGVVFKAAMLYGETFNSKVQVGYEMLWEGIASGKITELTTVIAASSGNTGLGLALLCKLLGLKCRIIVANDVPSSKVGLITALGSPIEVVLHTSKDESTVTRARREGLGDGCFDTDQYANPANLDAQCKYLAPQLWATNQEGINIVVVASGTLGTAGGIKRYVEKRDLGATVVLAVCAPDEEVPGARTKESIRRDVKTARLEDFLHIEMGERYQSFLASYALQAIAPLTPPGPTSGLAFLGALRFVDRIRGAGVLDQFRGSDNIVRVVFLCPDDYRLYSDLYRSELKGRNFAGDRVDSKELLLQK